MKQHEYWHIADRYTSACAPTQCMDASTGTRTRSHNVCWVNHKEQMIMGPMGSDWMEGSGDVITSRARRLPTCIKGSSL